MTVLSVFDAAGRRRSPATMPGYHAGRPPRNKGLRYPADPPTVEEIVAVMRLTSDDRHGSRLRADGVARCWCERQGGRRRVAGMDEWGREQLRSWLSARAELPVGLLFCIIDGPTRGATVVRRRGPSSAGSLPERASGAGSRRTSCATRTLSSSPARASRSTSSSASSGTPTSARHRSTSKGSTPRRSSPPSVHAGRR